MSTLSSASTLAEVQAAFDDNCDYDLENSVTKCKSFIQAARILLRRMVEEVEKGGERVQDAYVKIEHQLEAAEVWWRANDSNAATATASGSVTHADLRYLRD